MSEVFSGNVLATFVDNLYIIILSAINKSLYSDITFITESHKRFTKRTQGTVETPKGQLIQSQDKFSPNKKILIIMNEKITVSKHLNSLKRKEVYKRDRNAYMLMIEHLNIHNARLSNQRQKAMKGSVFHKYQGKMYLSQNLN